MEYHDLGAVREVCGDILDFREHPSDERVYSPSGGDLVKFWRAVHLDRGRRKDIRNEQDAR